MKPLRKLIGIIALAMVLSVCSYAPAADITVTAASVVPDSGFAYVDTTAGATITAGQVVYIDTSSTAQLAKNDTAVHAAARGIALHGASANQPLKVMTGGVITAGGTVVVGKVYTVSANAGGIAPITDSTSGMYVTILGVGTSATKITLSIKAFGVAVP